MNNSHDVHPYLSCLTYHLPQATTFHIADEEGFGTFAQWLVSEEEFTWQVRCPEVHAEGFSFFPVYKQLEFVKDVIIKGINNFEDIHIIVGFTILGL